MATRALLGHLLTLGSVLVMASPTVAQAPPAGVVTAARGQITVARTGGAPRVPLKFKDDVFLQDRIETGDESFGRILLGGKALVTVRERSVLTITEEPGRATVELGRGQAVLSLGKSLLKPGESVELRTPSAVAAIRGSTIIAIVGDGSETIGAFAVSKPVLLTLLNGGTLELQSHQLVDILGIGGATSFSAIRPVPPGLMKLLEQPKGGKVQPLPDQVIQELQHAAANSAPPIVPPGQGSNSGFGVFENPCKYSPGSCAPPVTPPVVPPGPPPPGPPQIQPVGVVSVPVLGAGPPGPPPPGPPPVIPPVVVPPTPPAGDAFRPPGHGGAQPGTAGNVPPGHGGTPPGHMKPPPGQLKK